MERRSSSQRSIGWENNYKELVLVHSHTCPGYGEGSEGYEDGEGLEEKP